MSQSASVSTASVSRVTPSARRAVHLAVGEVGGGPRGDLHAGAPDLVHLAADRLQRGVLAGHRQARRPRRGAPGSAPDAGGRRRARRRPPARPTTTSHSSNTPPPPSSTAMPSPAGLSTVQRRTVGRAPAAHLDAGRGTRHDPQVQSAPACRPRRAARARPSPGPRCAGPAPRRRRARSAARRPAGAMRTEPGEPSGPRRVTARCTTRFSRYVPGATVRTSPSPAASRAAASEAYSPVRRRHRDVPVCVTWTVPCAMALLCPHLVVLMARSPPGAPAGRGEGARAQPFGPSRSPTLSTALEQGTPSVSAPARPYGSLARGLSAEQFGRSTVACAERGG